MRKTLLFSFKKSIPVLFGYLGIGLAFGIMLADAGYNFIWAFFMSALILGGSIQFVMVGFLTAGTPLLTVTVMTLLINSRHIFYGLSFLSRFKKMGRKYPYMVFSLTDETYSILCSLNCPADVDPDRAMFFIALFDHSYWTIGSMLGALIGQLIPFDFSGVDFAMTALFVVIFLDQWRDYKGHIPALTGLVSAGISLPLFGADHFILPSLVITVAALMLLKPIVVKSPDFAQTGFPSPAEPENECPPPEGETDDSSSAKQGAGCPPCAAQQESEATEK